MNERGQLVGDRERERTVERLREACAEGRLTLAEFSERMGTALAARTSAELDTLTADLGAPAAGSGHRRGVTRRVTAVLGSTGQQGHWRVAEQVRATAVMGECKLDLRNTEVAGTELSITATAVMGSVKILVPEAAEVEMDGWCLLGSREHAREPSFFERIRHLITAPDRGGLPARPPLPLIRIRTRVVMGEIRVEHAP